MKSNMMITAVAFLCVMTLVTTGILIPTIEDQSRESVSVSNEGAGWIRLAYDQSADATFNYGISLLDDGGAEIYSDGGDTPVMQGTTDTILYADNNMAVWTEKGTAHVLGTSGQDKVVANLSEGVTIERNTEGVKVYDSSDVLVASFGVPTWSYIPKADGIYGFFPNGTDVVKYPDNMPQAIVGDFAGVTAYNNLVSMDDLGLNLHVTGDAGRIAGAVWDSTVALTSGPDNTVDPDMVTLDPGMIQPIDTTPISGENQLMSVPPTPQYTDGDWGYNLSGNNATIVSYSGSSGANVDITIPSSVGGHPVTKVGGGSVAIFDTSLSFGSLTIPSSVTSIGANAFNGCSGFTGSLTIPSSVTSIENLAFYNCSGFTGMLTIPSSVTSIGANSFGGCSGFTGSLTIPSSVTSIGTYTFEGCSGFTGTLTIPSSVTSIKNNTFNGCSGFTGMLTIPSSVTSIGNSAFRGCSGFTGSLTIPSSVTSIGANAFNGCSGFTGTLTIPSSVTSIEELAFNSCSGFTGSLTIPSSVTSIGGSAFNGCSGFTGSLTIPSSVTSIGGSAFNGCSSIKDMIVLSNATPSLNSFINSGIKEVLNLGTAEYTTTSYGLTADEVRTDIPATGYVSVVSYSQTVTKEGGVYTLLSLVPLIITLGLALFAVKIFMSRRDWQ